MTSSTTPTTTPTASRTRPVAVRLRIRRTTETQKPHNSNTPGLTTETDYHDSARYRQWVLMVPGTPLSFCFRARQLSAGLRAAAGVIFGLGAGGFLVTHIPSSLGLRVQVTFVAVVCLLMAVALLPFAAGYLFGKLRIDAYGISMSPRLIGFRISWQDLKCWSIEGLQLHLLSNKSSKEEIAPLHVLSPVDRLTVRDIMKECAGEREERLSAAFGKQPANGTKTSQQTGSIPG